MNHNARVFHVMWLGVYNTKTSVLPKLPGVYVNMTSRFFKSDLVPLWMYQLGSQEPKISGYVETV